MKKLLLLLILVPTIVWGASFNGAFNGATGSSGGGETLYEDQESVTTSAWFQIGRFSIYYAVSNFRASATYTPTKVTAEVRRFGTGGTVKEGILFADNGSETGPITTGPLCTGEDIDPSAFSVVKTLEEFPLTSCPEITSGVLYWIGIHEVDESGSDTDYIEYMYDSASGPNSIQRAQADNSWTEQDAAATGKYGVYGN